MDFNALKDQVSNLTFYDLKAGVRKVQNGKRSLKGFDSVLRALAEFKSCYELYRNGGKGSALLSA